MARTIPAPCRTCGRISCDHGKRGVDPRASAHRRGYDSRWAKVRELVLSGEPWCRRCADRGQVAEAVHVHHRHKLRDGGAHAPGELREAPTPRGPMPRWDGNLEPLCAACHNAATARGE